MSFGKLALQLPGNPGRPHYMKAKVKVRRRAGLPAEKADKSICCQQLAARDRHFAPKT